MSERMSNEAVVERGLDALGASGVGAGEVFLKEARSGSVEIKDGAVENVIARGERGIGVRILDAQRLGFAHSSDLSEEGIVACVEQAKRMSGVTEPDADLGLATRPLDDVDLDIFQRGLEDRAVGEFAEVALPLGERHDLTFHLRDNPVAIERRVDSPRLEVGVGVQQLL